MSLTRKIWIRNSFTFPFFKLNIQELLPKIYQNILLKSTESRKEFGILLEFTQDVDLVKVNAHLQENASFFRKFKGISSIFVNIYRETSQGRSIYSGFNAGKGFKEIKGFKYWKF